MPHRGAPPAGYRWPVTSAESQAFIDTGELPRTVPSTGTVHVTTLEADVLRGIVGSQYDRPIWSWAIAARIATPRQMGGLVASLVRKGLVTCSGTGRESIVDLTPLGETVHAALPSA